jgi:hypothetical protein
VQGPIDDGDPVIGPPVLEGGGEQRSKDLPRASEREGSGERNLEMCSVDEAVSEDFVIVAI